MSPEPLGLFTEMLGEDRGGGPTAYAQHLPSSYSGPVPSLAPKAGGGGGQLDTLSSSLEHLSLPTKGRLQRRRGKKMWARKSEHLNLKTWLPS